MNMSEIFKNAVINLYKHKRYIVDYAIIKAAELADKNRINAQDYEELLAYLAEEQLKEMQKEIIKPEEEIIESEEEQLQEEIGKEMTPVKEEVVE